MKNNNMTHIFSLNSKSSRRILLTPGLLCALTAAVSVGGSTPGQAAYPPTATGSHGAVAADHELASQAGVEILSQGGNAVDAAIAAALALGVVQPAGSGLGGGGFLLIRTSSGQIAAIDFREVAPKLATRDMFIDASSGKEVPERSRWGGLASGVPGEAAGFAKALSEFGTMKPAQVIAPALRLADRGFPAGRHLARSAAMVVPKLAEPHPLRALLAPQGKLLTVGMTVRRPELASTLRMLSQAGFLAFYKTQPGAIGDDLLQANRSAGGLLQAEDLASYKPIARTPMTGRFRNHQLFVIPPPSGGITALEALQILNARPALALGPTASATLHETIESLKHAFADRAKLHGDPAFTNIPVEELASAAYASGRAATIQPDRVLPPQSYGRPGTDKPLSPPRDKGTSHLCVIDRNGNAAALTTTVNLSFGARVVGAKSGVLLNNQMDDFTAKPATENAFGLVGDEANLVAPGKRPASSMTPLIAVGPDGTVMCAGGSGGPTIVTGVVQTLINLIDFGMDAEAAVSAPRIHAQFLPDSVLIEPEIPSDVRDKLTARGHKLVVTPAPLETAVQVVVYRPASGTQPATWTAASDPRKGGKPAIAPR